MARYRIHIPLQDFEGAKSERTYTCTRGAAFEAPEGEFKTLTPGSEYSRIDGDVQAQEHEDKHPHPPEPDTE